MDFSKFTNDISMQQEKFNNVKNGYDAQAYDSICSSLNGVLADISLVAGFIPKESKFELIGILKSLRALCVELVDYKAKLIAHANGADVIPDKPVEVTPSESNTESLGQSAPVNANVKALTLNNPNIPNGASQIAA